MDRDPLALPGDPGYKSGPDSDIEVVTEDDDNEGDVKVANSSTVLKVELVPADADYVRKITGNNRGRKRKDELKNEIKVIETSDTRLNVKMIQPMTNGDTEEESEGSFEEKIDGRGRYLRKKKIGRPRKKKKPVENYFKPNPKSTHHSRSLRYEQLQEKKDEFLQVQAVRKAEFKERYQKHLERAKEKYREKKAASEPKSEEKILLPFQKKLQRKICMLAIKIRHIDKSKTKDQLIQEMAVEWKENREKFWENYKKRWKEVSQRSVKPMTEERAEFLRQRGHRYEKLKQEQTLMLNRVSTRNRNKKDYNEDSPGSSMMDYPETQNYDGIEEDETCLMYYDEYLDEDFVAEEESFHNTDHNDTYLYNVQSEEGLEDGFETTFNTDDTPYYYDEDHIELEEFPAEETEIL